MDPFMNENINISDVIDAIQTTDPGFVESNRREDQRSLNMSSVAGAAGGGGGGGDEPVKLAEVDNSRQGIYAEIVEQPASKALRFRYECEGRSAGSIPGVNSTPENKTYPSIRIVHSNRRAVVVVSCVTKDPPYRPHPHNLVGKEACRRGVCTVEISSENMTVTFANLGIQCVKKKDIEEALRVREDIRVDPFRTGFEHKKQPTSIDLNAVRLCFQVFLEGEKGKFTVPLPPIVSDPIYDKKAMSDLVICKLSHCSASVAGGTEMMLLCEKVAKEDIQVRFFEEKDNQVVWEKFADFQPAHVHKQVAIAFRTPAYHNQQIDQPVQVYIQLKRPTDGTTSDALPFQMLPLGADDPDSLKRKRQKLNNSPSSLVRRHVQAEAETHERMMIQPIQYNFNIVKPEPIDSMLGYGSMSTAASSSFYPVGATSPITTQNVQNLTTILSPHRTPSPMDCITYNHPGVHQNLNRYETSPQHVSPSFEPQLTYNNQPVTINRPTPEQNPVNTQNANSVLDLDNNQFGFDQLIQFDGLNSADLAVFGTALSENFSTGLSISDTNRGQTAREIPGSVVEGSSMTDSLTNLTDRTIQELCTLNNMYRDYKDNVE